MLATIQSRVILISLLVVALFGDGIAQDKSVYEKRSYIGAKGDTLHYRLLLPLNYDSTQTYPLIVFLHGSGERGSDNELQLFHGWQLFLTDSIRKNYPAIVVLPQCPLADRWSARAYAACEKRNPSKHISPTVSLQLVNDLVDNLVKRKAVDKKRLYIMGLSMGGFGTLESLGRWPTTYAAAVPICGGGNLNDVKRYSRRTAVWLFHGSDDKAVSPDYSRTLYKQLVEQGCDVRYTEYPGVGHGSWHNAFAEPDFFHWLFSKHK